MTGQQDSISGPKNQTPIVQLTDFSCETTSYSAERRDTLLWQMIDDISGELALEPLLTRIVERACTLIGADNGAIGLYDPQIDCVRTVASKNIPEEQLCSVLPRGQGLMGRVLELDAPVYCRYGNLPHPVRAAAMEMHMIGMPIRIRGELIGVFGIAVSPSTKFEKTAQVSLEKFARHAAYAIDNARRHSLEQRRTERFLLIVRVAGIIASGSDIDSTLESAADAIHEILGYPNVEIPLLDVNDPEILVTRIRGGCYKRLIPIEDRMPIERGIMGAAVRERRAQLVNDVRSDPRYVVLHDIIIPQAELAVPILIGDEVLGVLNVEGPQTFDELDLQSLEVIAEHLALAIRSARFSDEVRQLALLEERQRLARDLHDNVTQILSSIGMISQTLADSWSRDPAEGALRTARLSQLAQMGFSGLHDLLGELSPVADSRRSRVESDEQIVQGGTGGVQIDDRGLAEMTEFLISSMLPSQMTRRMEFSTYRPQSMEYEKALLRICQEAASNAIRHANASHLEIEAGVDEDDVWIRISDDGRGISVRGPPGRGIANMWQRVLTFGGSFHVAARLPRGTRVEARLPRHDRAP